MMCLGKSTTRIVPSPLEYLQCIKKIEPWRSKIEQTTLWQSNHVCQNKRWTLRTVRIEISVTRSMFESKYQLQEVCIQRATCLRVGKDTFFLSPEETLVLFSSAVLLLLSRYFALYSSLSFNKFLQRLRPLQYIQKKTNSVPGPAIDFVISYLLYKLSRNLILLPARHILSFTSVGHKRLCAVDQASDGKKQATPKQSAPAATRSAGLLEDQENPSPERTRARQLLRLSSSALCVSTPSFSSCHPYEWLTIVDRTSIRLH